MVRFTFAFQNDNQHCHRQLRDKGSHNSEVPCREPESEIQYKERCPNEFWPPPNSKHITEQEKVSKHVREDEGDGTSDRPDSIRGNRAKANRQPVDTRESEPACPRFALVGQAHDFG